MVADDAIEYLSPRDAAAVEMYRRANRWEEHTGALAAVLRMHSRGGV